MAGFFLLKMKQTKRGKLAETSFGERGGASDKLRFFVKKIEMKSFAPTTSRRRKNKRQAITLAVQ